MTHGSRWRRLGVVVPPPAGRASWCISHAAVPIAEPLDADHWRVYFSCRDDRGRSSVSWAVVDVAARQAVEHASGPVLAPGAPGTFDDSGAMGSWLVPAPVERLYYIGWNVGGSLPFRNAIGAADRDGGEFRRISSGPVVDRGIHDPIFTASSCVLVEDGRWRMWYLSCVEWAPPAAHRYHLKYAESRDGVDWRRDGRVAIDFASAEEYAISRPSVLRDAAGYHMWFSHRGDRYRIGYAASADGIAWDRGGGPTLDPGDDAWESEMVEYPFVLDHDGARYMLYNGNGYGATGIGLAVLE